jgi:hypothetical protein
MPERKCLPIPPCLDVSALKPKRRPHTNIVDLHRGWTAARAGLDQDATETAAWLEGWLLWHQRHPDPVQLSIVVDGCIRQLRAKLQELQQAEMPRVFPCC